MTQWGLDTLFNPAKRHMDEEKRRLQSTREEIGDSSGGKRIDLESGKVVIARAEDDSDEAGEPSAEKSAATQKAAAEKAQKKVDRVETPAQARARAQDANDARARSNRSRLHLGRPAGVRHGGRFVVRNRDQLAAEAPIGQRMRRLP